MRSLRPTLAAAALSLGLFLPLTFAADKAKSYQVTGTVVEVDDKKIVVEKKDGEKWELARDGETKVDGDLKVGGKVTIHYVMVAGDVEAKAGPTTKPN